MLSASKLFLALLLPAILGYTLLRLAAPHSPRQPGQRSAALGVGLLLGNALIALAMWLDARLLGEFHSNALLCLISLLALLLVRQLGRRQSGSEPELSWSRAMRPAAGAQTTLAVLLLALILGHLLLIAVEILWRPVFPWDAWLNWMYRAKVWFYGDGMLPFSEPGLWLQGERAGEYNVAGAHYPTLLPLLAVWTAGAIGHWSETLINLPTLLLGAALALAMYGYCRRAGGNAVIALAAATALLSTPLIGSHLALAGQADIWLAGYSGLGLVALLHGLMDNQRRSLWLGLLLCLIGTAVKLDAWLWLAIAVTLALLRHRLRQAALACCAALICLGVLALLLPDSWLMEIASSLPLSAALAGEQALGRELGEDYLANYWLGASWHLGGWLIALSALWALWQLRRGDDREAAALLAFSALQAILLLLVFSFSRHGAWADDWTAINRLPLQLLPAHCYLWSRLARRLLAGGAPRRPLWQPALLAIALAAAAAASVLWQSGDPVAEERRFAGSALRPVVGAGSRKDSALSLDRYSNNIALATTGPLRLDLSRLPLVELRTVGSPTQRVTLFWRRAADQTLQRVAIGGRGTVLVDLRRLAEDSPLISEAGVLAYGGENPTPLIIEELRFLPATPLQILRRHWLAWNQASRWNQRSVHWTSLGAEVPLTATLAAASLVLSFALAILLLDRGRGMGRRLVPAIALLWLLLDLRWLLNLSGQAQDTVADYPFLRASTHAFSDDSRIAAAVAAALATRDEGDAAPSRPLLISAERRDLRYQMLRAKYHAAPTAALVLEAWPPQAVHAGDDLLLLRSSYGGRDASERSLTDFAERIAARQLRLRVLTEDRGSTLARIE